ncbi:hypothetical protein OCT51_01935 [Halomonas sp. LR3S48]|uniref:hypothetical protein n=1 Tax=Halomonas sp. LR3S48 TaxID=2982694 RepID=UPI0021E497BE|nr:hypothetical protein [Halomonas sp. LR3S48]UYG04149.1 hypothetical protein OCT51_01935 [Halomonas sp. LR3S48]
MMSNEFLKKLGVVGIAFGLTASPLALADFHDEEENQETYPEETAPDTNGNAQSDADFDSVEYENEEEEWETDEWEEENEEEEWETDEWEEENEEEEWEEEGDADQDW